MTDFPMKHGHTFLLAEAAGGVYNTDQLRLIAEVVDRTPGGFLKITEDQRLGFLAEEGEAQNLAAECASRGLPLRGYRGRGWPAPKACLGELCPHAEQEALGDALGMTGHLREKLPAAFPYVSMGMNGCSRGCASSSTDDLHIVGEASGYKICIGGKTQEIPQCAEHLAENIGAPDLPATVLSILETYASLRVDEETFSQTLERVGTHVFAGSQSQDLTSSGELLSEDGQSEEDTLDALRDLDGGASPGDSFSTQYPGQTGDTDEETDLLSTLTGTAGEGLPQEGARESGENPEAPAEISEEEGQPTQADALPQDEMPELDVLGDTGSPPQDPQLPDEFLGLDTDEGSLDDASRISREIRSELSRQPVRVPRDTGAHTARVIPMPAAPPRLGVSLEGGFVRIGLTSGAQVTIPLEALGPGAKLDLSVDGQELALERSGSCVRVHLGDLCIELSQRQAA